MLLGNIFKAREMPTLSSNSYFHTGYGDNPEKLSCAREEIKYENETTQLLVRVIMSAVILGLY